MESGWEHGLVEMLAWQLVRGWEPQLVFLKACG
jgi:hypothetical protein